MTSPAHLSSELNTTDELNVDILLNESDMDRSQNSSCDFNTDNITKQQTRKRKVNKKEWASSKRKKFRNQGMEYVSCKGKMVRARQVSPRNCKCKLCEQISDTERNSIFSEYWHTGSYERQREYIVNLIDEHETRSHRTHTKKPHIQVRRHYHLITSQGRVRVCKQFFLGTLSIKKNTVEYAFKKKMPHNTVLHDMRGKQKNASKVTEEQKQYVRRHILSFHVVDSHYIRESSKRKYLPEGLNITKMFEMYKDYMAELGVKNLIVKEWNYRNIFNTKFNYSFHKPKKDRCLICENGIPEDENEKTRYEKHIQQKERAREENEVDYQKAKKDSTYRVGSFDLQKVLNTPCGDVSNLYYTRKLSVYNFCVFERVTSTGTCYLWDETNGARGSCEIGTCVYKHITSYPKNIKKIIFYSDNCAGQNLNRFLSVAMLEAIKTNTSLDVLDHKFNVSGHTQMPVDSMHGTIENAKKAIKIIVPRDWFNVLTLARRKNRFITIPMDYPCFIDWKKVAEQYQLKHDTDGRPVKWSDIVHFRYTRESPDSIYFKYDFDQNFKQIKVVSSTRTNRKMKKCSQSLPKLYSSLLPISAAKKKDLLNLCKKEIIPSVHHHYYENLPSTEEV